MKTDPRGEGQDKIPQTELVEMLKRCNLANGEYLFDVSPDDTIKVSRLRKKDVSPQATYTPEEFSAFLQHKDLDKGQYSVIVEGNTIRFLSIRKYWMNREDF